MADKKKESVKSPSNSIEGVIKNSGGLPPTLEPKSIWKENQPPKTPAKNSTEGLGSK